MKLSWKRVNQGKQYTVKLTTDKGVYQLTFYPFIWKWIKTEKYWDLYVSLPGFSIYYITDDWEDNYNKYKCISDKELEDLCDPF